MWAPHYHLVNRFTDQSLLGKDTAMSKAKTGATARIVARPLPIGRGGVEVWAFQGNKYLGSVEVGADGIRWYQRRWSKKSVLPRKLTWDELSRLSKSDGRR